MYKMLANTCGLVIRALVNMCVIGCYCVLQGPPGPPGQTGAPGNLGPPVSYNHMQQTLTVSNHKHIHILFYF